MGKALTEKQRRFVEAYMGEAAGNGLAAARAAGYSGSEATLRAIASENLTKPAVREAIDARVAADPKVMKREELQDWWTKVIRGEVLPRSKTRDRLKASELLAKSQAVFVQKVEHSGPGGGPIPVEARDLRPNTADMTPEQLERYERSLEEQRALMEELAATATEANQ